MLIRVIYRNERYDFVKPSLLGRLIKKDRVKMFLRRSGWAAADRDAVRGSGGEYHGPERRSHS